MFLYFSAILGSECSYFALNCHTFIIAKNQIKLRRLGDFVCSVFFVIGSKQYLQCFFFFFCQKDSVLPLLLFF